MRPICPLPALSVLLLGLAVLAGCAGSGNGAADKVLSQNDFESMAGWAPATPSLTTERAHSGRYAMKVGEGLEFGANFSSPLVQVSPTRLQKLRVSAWALLTNLDTEAQLVVEVKNPADDSQKIFWESFTLNSKVKSVNSWTKVGKTFTLPATLNPTDELRVYLWRGASPAAVYLDDVELTRED